MALILAPQKAVLQASQVEAARRNCVGVIVVLQFSPGRSQPWHGLALVRTCAVPTLANSEQSTPQCLCTSPRCRHAVQTLSPARPLTTLSFIQSVPAGRALIVREISPARPSCHRHAKTPDDTTPQTHRNTRLVAHPRREVCSDVAVCPERGPRTIRRWSQGTPELPSTLLPTPVFYSNLCLWLWHSQHHHNSPSTALPLTIHLPATGWPLSYSDTGLRTITIYHLGKPAVQWGLRPSPRNAPFGSRLEGLPSDTRLYLSDIALVAHVVTGPPS